VESNDARRAATGDARRPLIQIGKSTSELPSKKLAPCPANTGRHGASKNSDTNQDALLVLVLVDGLADPILLPVNPVLFCFREMAVVRCHVLLLAILHACFAFL